MSPPIDPTPTDPSTPPIDPSDVDPSINTAPYFEATLEPITLFNNQSVSYTFPAIMDAEFD